MGGNGGKGGRNRLIGLAVLGLLGAAVVKELRQPAAERTWTGRVVGVPYDLRRPTVGKVRREYWDPENPALFTPHSFGIGYGVNLARVGALARRAAGAVRCR
ncbi:DUF5808 domain-containing protein [Phaeacidiphilus oryzae]|uniref:DUF5808 domain-containing protein n=1 Tax=Phaeacidiphilus oryzae TaxID=348818 RepID=UPI0005616007|nr:DUF5808 domain-containing protein [Phaeacidiphilus oryzae]